MGLGYGVVEVIVREHSVRSITGNVLLIGRQTMYLTPAEALRLLSDHGFDTRGMSAADIARDTDTTNRAEWITDYVGKPLIRDTALFGLLGVTNVRALDSSDYEGAELLHDLNKPIPAQLMGCADFVVDGSTLDNVFNPALALRNLAEMLKPGGRLLSVNAYSNHHDPYLIPTPLWYLDYFVINKFADCRVYILVDTPWGPNVFCINFDWLLDEGRDVVNFVSPYVMSTIVFAEKGLGSTTDVWPTQRHYRSERNWTEYRQNLSVIRRSSRPHIVRSYAPMAFFDVRGGHLFIGQNYEALDPATEEARIRSLAQTHRADALQATHDAAQRGSTTDHQNG